MDQIIRPHIQLTWIELHKKAVDHYEDIDYLQRILVELQFRRTNKARNLYREIANHVAELSAKDLHTFRWPSTAVNKDSNQALEDGHFNYEEGLLKYMGYSVGQNGAYRSQRREVLNYIYNGQLPRVQSQEYMDQWAESKTSSRLQKLANTIATLARNAKRRHNDDMSLAISEWEEDLTYLKETYYDAGTFRWPD